MINLEVIWIHEVPKKEYVFTGQRTVKESDVKLLFVFDVISVPNLVLKNGELIYSGAEPWKPVVSKQQKSVKSKAKSFYTLYNGELASLDLHGVVSFKGFNNDDITVIENYAQKNKYSLKTINKELFILSKPKKTVVCTSKGEFRFPDDTVREYFNISNLGDVLELDLRGFNTSNLTDMSYMFAACNVRALNLSKFNTSNVTNMEAMFHGCWADALDLSSFDTRKVTNMKCMFEYYNSVTTVNLSSFDTFGVRNMKNMFAFSMFTELNLSNFNLLSLSVVNTDGMFQYCDAKIKGWNVKPNQMRG